MKATINPETAIPSGVYCYKILDIIESKDGKPPIYITYSCPFWSINKKKPKQRNGYCSYLGKGDWNMGYHPRVVWEKGRKVDYIDKSVMFYGLLWDACKECDVKNHWDDEDD